MPARLPHMQIQDQAIALFKEVLQDRMGECLDRWFPGDALVQLDQIAIDLGPIHVENWEEVFLSRFMEEFELALEAAHTAHAIETASQSQGQASALADDGSQARGPWAALAYFLAQGFLPWWHPERQKSSIQDLVQALIDGPEGMSAALQAHIRHALRSPLALKRLVQALPDTLLAALGQAMGILEEASGAALGGLTQLLTLPAQGISRIAARYAVWEAVLAGQGGRRLPEEVLAEAILSLATTVQTSPADLLQAAASSAADLSSDLLRDIARVQARLQEHPEQAQARAQEARLKRTATALQNWLQQADPQQFDLDKALSLLRDLQAALPPGALSEDLAGVIAQLNSARRASGTAPLAIPPSAALLRLHEAMRQDAAHCPAQVLLAMQEFYLQLSLLHAPAMQEKLLAAPMQQLAFAVMHLNASAGASSQGPYLHASARQLLATLDAQEKSALLQTSADVPDALVPIAHAPSAATMQMQASALIAAQIAALAHQGLHAPSTINLADWRAWFKALRGPGLRPLLGQASWRELLQAISELLAGQPQVLQLRTIAQLADACLQAVQAHHGPVASPTALRNALQELADLTDATASPGDFARTQARLRAIASLLHDTAAAHGGTDETASQEDISPQAAWQALRASLLALATFGSTALQAAGVSAAAITTLQQLVSLADSNATPAHVASGLRLMLDIRARLESVMQSQATQDAPALSSLGAVVSQQHPAFAAPEQPSEAVLKRIADLLQSLIALSARLELEFVARQQPPSAKSGLPDWRRVWDVLRLYIDAPSSENELVQDAREARDGNWQTSIDPAGHIASSSSRAATPAWQILGTPLDETPVETENLVSPFLRRQDKQTSLPPIAEPPRSLALYFLDADEFHVTAWDPARVLLAEEVRQVAQLRFSALETSEALEPGQPVLHHAAASRRVQRLLAHTEASDVPSKENQAVVSAPTKIQAPKASLHHLDVLASPALETAAAELLLGIAHLLAPALAGETMSHPHIAWWNSSSADVVAHMIAALDAGQVSHSLMLDWEQLRTSESSHLLLPNTATWSPLKESSDGGSALAYSNGRDHSASLENTSEWEQRMQAHDEAKSGKEVALPSNQTAWESGQGFPWSGANENGQVPAQPNRLQKSPRALRKKADDPANLQRNGYLRPQFRCLWMDAEAESTPDGLGSPSPEAAPTAAGWTDLPPSLKAAAQRRSAPYSVALQPSLAAIRVESLQAHHHYLLDLGSEGVARLLESQTAQAAANSPLLRQIQQWMRQFPGQALPPSLAKALTSALAVLDLAVKVPLDQQEKSVAGNDIHTSAPTSRAASPALPKITLAASDAFLPSMHSQLLRPRPLPILPMRVFQARAEQLLSCVQKLLSHPTPTKGLRRTLDRLAQQAQPAPITPSLSETGRQQLAEAATRVKALLREPLPAHMHAALRALQGKLLGQAQGRPDLRAVQRISAQANALLTTQLKGKPAPKTPEKELSIYVQNAGLVLLWPFIPRFFQNLGLVEGREFVSPEAHGRAVLFLQYLADPDPETAEHLLPLCKLLCGYPDDSPIHLELLPSEEEIAACEGLLATVPSHHPAMKNMRVEGFRSAWLQREGALKPRGDHHLLHVEKQAYDILLEQLPWSIRVIRLPWMHTAILTEW